VREKAQKPKKYKNLLIYHKAPMMLKHLESRDKVIVVAMVDKLEIYLLI
jgi:hypothetical protein